ncbi:MAG: helix-turn-helix domain-containing protein [Janthinobacterium lividum]
METTVGGRLRQFREYKGLKGTPFAERAGIKQTTFSAIENGDSVPSYPILQKLFTAYPDLASDWLLMGEGSMLKGGQALAPAAKPASPATTPETESPTPPPAGEVPSLAPAVRRKHYRPIMSTEPDLRHLTPEQRAEYWKRRHDRLLAEQAQAYENEVHQETLQLVNFRSASSNAADLYAFADSLAVDYPCPSAEMRQRVESIAKFRPAARVIQMRPVVAGFQQQAAAGR